MKHNMKDLFTSSTDVIGIYSTELIFVGSVVVALVLAVVIARYMRNNMTIRSQQRSIIAHLKHTAQAVMVFKQDQLVWLNNQAIEFCPFAATGTTVDEVIWKYSGTLEQHASLYKGKFKVYTLAPVEVKEVAVETEVDFPKATKEFSNFKLFNDEMEVFEKVLMDNQFLLNTSGITVFANKNKGDLELFPNFEQLAEAFLRVGHYLVKDRSNAHMDFLFDVHQNHHFIQMNLRNFKSPAQMFGEDFYLKGFGTETFEYQLHRLETVFQSMGGSLQLVDAGKDLIFIGKVRGLHPLQSVTEKQMVA